MMALTLHSVCLFSQGFPRRGKMRLVTFASCKKKKIVKKLSASFTDAALIYGLRFYEW